MGVLSGVKFDEIAPLCIVETPTRQSCDNGVSAPYAYVHERTQAALRGAVQQAATRGYAMYPGVLLFWAELVLRELLLSFNHANQSLSTACIKVWKTPLSDS